MADYYRLFSADIKDLTDEELEWWANEDARIAALSDEDRDEDWENDEICDDFTVAPSSREVWFHNEESGNPQAVANVVQRFLKDCRPADYFAFAFALTCSRPVADSFGGGAFFVTARHINWVGTYEWLQVQKGRFEGPPHDLQRPTGRFTVDRD